MKNAIVSLLLLLAAGAQAQSPVAQPPADAEVVTGEALNARFAGKVFDYVIPASRASFRMEYNASGHAFVNGGNGLNDSGAYRIEGSRICTDWKKIPAGCVEVRVKGPLLYAQRSDGSWATMTPR